MAILIDGYNLLNAANIVAEGPGPYSLEKSRRSLLRFLVAVLETSERPTTTVVFDGREAPSGLPQASTYEQITVLFSQPGAEADDLLEELIPEYSAPRRLVVVSSDHRIQRAARRRQAMAVDSEVWTRQRVATRTTDATEDAEKSIGSAPLSDAEIADWLRRFGDVQVESLEAELQAETNREPQDSASRSPDDIDPDDVESSEDDEKDALQGFDPFPKGYGEDLL